MRIAYLCEFSAGIDGVWNRVYNIAKQLAKRHEVFVLSSDIVKGSESKAPEFEEKDGIKIHRFPITFRLGENALWWSYEKKLRELRPDIVHAHVFRHPHSTSAPRIARKIGARAFLTTHAPFVEHELRSTVLNLAVSLYDKVLARKVLNSYEKVIAIARWEIPILESSFGCKKEKIVYIPNGIPEEFLSHKPKSHNRKRKTMLFFGRIAPIKNIELLLHAFKEILGRGYDARLKLVGQMESGYDATIADLIKKLDIGARVDLPGPVYDLKKKISEIEKSDIFVLPSKREASPQALIEAMALGKIALSSNTAGGREFIRDGENGFLFKDRKELVNKLEHIIRNYSKLKKLSLRARKSVSALTWRNLARKEEQIYTK